jgi:hypothetical protein
MPVKKKLLSGNAFSWGYEFAIGTRGTRKRYKQSGFASRSKAINAESAKRLEIEREEKINATGTLGQALEKFFEDRGASLSPKTIARYREMADYLAPELKTAPIAKSARCIYTTNGNASSHPAAITERRRRRAPCPPKPCATSPASYPAPARGRSYTA